MQEDRSSPLHEPWLQWHTPDNGLKAPDETSLSHYRLLKTTYWLMVEKHPGRKRAPLQFVDAFRAFQDAVAQSKNWVWPQVADEVDYMRRFAATLQSAYEICREPARELKRRKLGAMKRAA